MLKHLTIAICLLLVGCKGSSQEKDQLETGQNKTGESYAIDKTEEEWRNELTDMEFYILRKAGTEIAGTSELLDNMQKGTYVCAGCGTPLFKSENKYDSGTGWPSFDREIEGNIAYDIEHQNTYTGTEEHCAVCGGHLGHVFNDGPRETTGIRHCINGAALDFIPNKGAQSDP
jgi:peptide-methionine (R)-S-oxide reductase